MKLELNDQNIDKVLALRKRDIMARDAYVDVTPEEAYIIVPDSYSEMRQFIMVWLPLCPDGTEKRIEKFKKALKRRSFLKGYGINEDMTDYMVARFIAGIKLETVKKQDEMMRQAHKHLKAEYMGYTYLNEIGIIMQRFLEETEAIENDASTVAAYDDLRQKF